MKDNFSGLVAFSTGLIFGIVIMFFADRSDLTEQDKIIAKLEAEIKIKPLITVDALGICKVTQGGKSYLLIDITNETKALDEDQTCKK